MKKEELFLLYNSHVLVPDENVQYVRNNILNNLDWNDLIDLAIYHKTLPLIYNSIFKYYSLEVPSEIYGKIKRRQVLNAVKNIQAANTLEKIVDLLNANNIDVLTFKGPVLAHDIYGDVTLRTFNDIDLLVSWKNIRKAITLLAEDGFDLEVDLSRDEYISLLKNRHHAVLIKNNVCVELHWELTGRYFSNKITIDSLLPHAESVYMNGKEFLTLRGEDLLIYLCIHATRHHWCQLDLVCGINELIRKRDDLDWLLVERVARERSCLNMVVLALIVVRNVLGLPLNQYMEGLLEKKSYLENVANRYVPVRAIISGGLAESEMTYFSYVRYHGSVIDRKRDKIVYCLRPIVNPNEKDWLWIRLPVWLSFLYYVLRPLRLLSKYSRIVVRFWRTERSNKSIINS